MSATNIALISNIKPKNIIRTVSPLVSELGAFSTALVLYDTVYRLTNREGAVWLGEKLEEYFPLYGEIVETGLSPTEIELTIEKVIEAVIENLRDFSSIVVVGIESVFLDNLSRKLPESQVYFIPHSENIEEERVLANFPSNVHLADVREVMSLGGLRSVLLSYIFCQIQEDSFVYPVALRSIGPDVRSSYNQIIGLNILSDYKRYLSDMTPLYATSQFFTSQYRVV